MLRAQKVKVVDELHAVFTRAAVVVVAHYKGLNVPEMSALRARMREHGGRLRVVKNRLAKRALAGTRYEGLAPLLAGPSAIAWAEQDPVAPPKVLVEFAKGNDKLVIVGGALGETLLDAEAVRALAQLPSLDELRARLVGLLQAPAGQLVRLLGEPGARLARVLRARGEQAAG